MNDFYKIILIVLVAFEAQASFIFAQQNPTIKLYYYDSAGVSNVFSGSLTPRPTDAYESLSVAITTSGPIGYGITPSELSLAPNDSNKTWQGIIWIDTTSPSFPNLGDSATAVLTANYTLTYSSPADHWYPPANPGGQQIASGSSWLCKGSPTNPCRAGHTSPSAHILITERGTRSFNFLIYHRHFNSHTQIVVYCGGIMRVVDTGMTACCGTTPYNPNLQKCSNCGETQHLVDTGMTECCGATDYNPHLQRCSNCGGIQQVVDAGMTDCCGNAAYNPHLQRCSFCALWGMGMFSHLTDINNTECCDGTDYDPHTQRCSECAAQPILGILFRHVVDINLTDCCSGTDFDPHTHRCITCSTMGIPGIPQVVNMGVTDCCNGVPFDPTIYKCDGNQIVPR